LKDPRKEKKTNCLFFGIFVRILFLTIIKKSPFYSIVLAVFIVSPCDLD